MREAQDDTRLRVPEEEQSRADCYALISRLFYAAPDAALLASIAASAVRVVDSDTALTLQVPANGYLSACGVLQEMAREADADALRQEYDDLFIGAGKAPITTYTASHALPHAPDRHLLELREQLAGWGLARGDGVFEMEDHVSAVCDVMRWLIERGRPVQEQRAFFEKFVHPGVVPFCAAIHAGSSAAFYRAVASFARAFLGVEKDAFDLHIE